MTRPTSSRRMAKLRRPELVAVAGRVEARALELERPRDPLAVARMDRGGDVGRRAQRGSPPGRARRSLAPPRRAPRRHRRAQVEVGQRRSQVEAGPADDDRAAALGQQPVDLGVRQGREAPGAELLASDRRSRPVDARAVPFARASPLRSASRALDRPGCASHEIATGSSPRARSSTRRPRSRPPSSRPPSGRRSRARSPVRRLAARRPRRASDARRAWSRWPRRSPRRPARRAAPRPRS